MESCTRLYSYHDVLSVFFVFGEVRLVSFCQRFQLSYYICHCFIIRFLQPMTILEYLQQQRFNCISTCLVFLVLYSHVVSWKCCRCRCFLDCLPSLLMRMRNFICDILTVHFVVEFIECPKGLFGPSCRSRCHCKNGESCNITTGKCPTEGCADNWHGPYCQTCIFCLVIFSFLTFLSLICAWF